MIWGSIGPKAIRIIYNIGSMLTEQSYVSISDTNFQATAKNADCRGLISLFRWKWTYTKMTLYQPLESSSPATAKL